MRSEYSVDLSHDEIAIVKLLRKLSSIRKHQTLPVHRKDSFASKLG